MYWSGVEEKERAKGGVGLIIAPGRLQDIIEEKYVDERIKTIQIRPTEKETWTMIIAYGQNEDARKEDR